MSSQQQGLDSILDAVEATRIQRQPETRAWTERQHLLSAQAFRRMVTVAETGADFLTSVAAVFLAYYSYRALSIGRHVSYPTVDLALFAATVGLLVALLFERESAYRGSTSLLRIRETERALRIPFLALMLLLPISFVVGQLFSRGALLCLSVLLPALLLVQKYLFFSSMQVLHARGYGVRRVVIYGAGYDGRRLFTALVQSPKLGFQPVAMMDDNLDLHGTPLYELGYSRRNAISVQGTQITADYLRSIGCDTLFIAIPGLSSEAILAAMQAAAEAKVQVAFLPDRLHLNAQTCESVDLDGVLLTFTANRANLSSYLATKRLFDLSLSLLLLVLFLPVLAFLSLLIRLDSPGPILFRQDRIGMNGKRFRIAKFRSMKADTLCYSKSPVEPDDERITRVGRFLRKTSLDELPQLLNVIRGEMSLVGPRPEMPFLVEEYDPIQRQRLQVLPGITGLWQLSADRAFHIHENPEYDMYYIRNRGFFLDIAILIHTAFFAMRGI
jgi:exopolysaccharide biosynthesis polyprenyl glycosylphosphotransferase